MTGYNRLTGHFLLKSRPRDYGRLRNRQQLCCFIYGLNLDINSSSSFETLCSLRTVGGHGGDDGGLAGAVLPGGLRGVLEAEGHARGAGLQAQGPDERGDGGQGQQGRRHRQEVRRREAALLHIVSGSQSCIR